MKLLLVSVNVDRNVVTKCCVMHSSSTRDDNFLSETATTDQRQFGQEPADNVVRFGLLNEPGEWLAQSETGIKARR